MSETAQLEDRLTELEARLAFQDKTIEDLNEVVSKQWAELDQLKRKLGMVQEQLQDVVDHPALANAPEPPPPHY